MKINFKIFRVYILLKLFLKITLLEILKFSCSYSPITPGIKLGNKYFWKIFKVENLFMREIAKGFKMLLFISKD